MNERGKDMDIDYKYMEEYEFLNLKDIGGVQNLIHLSDSFSPDNIKLTHEQDILLSKIWKSIIPSDKSTGPIPSDIVFANTIPLKDCYIEIDERNAEDLEYKSLVKYRVLIIDKYLDKIPLLENGEECPIGFVIETIDCIPKMAWYLGVIKGENGIGISQGCFFLGGTFDQRKRLACFYNLDEMTKQGMLHCHSLLTAWYSIQISLLHPRIKILYNNPLIRKNRDYAKANISERKRIVKYIKTYRFNDEELNNAIYGNANNKRNHKCLIWYVIGHWRTYKNGKQIFIQPYWKGELREMKQNLNERERIIDNE